MTNAKQWEYTTKTLAGETPIEDQMDDDATTLLNGYGLDGWELVSIRQDRRGASVLTFKRRLP